MLKSKYILAAILVLTGLTYYNYRKPNEQIEITRSKDNHTQLHQDELATNSKELDSLAIKEPANQLQTYNDAKIPEEISILLQLNSERKYTQCLNLALETLESSNVSQQVKVWIQNQLPIIRVNKAFEDIKKDNCNAAISVLIEIPKIDDYPLAHKGLGICYYKEKNFVRSESHLKSFLNSNNSDTEVFIVYSDLLESLGDFEKAYSLLNNALPKTDSSDPLYKVLQERKHQMSQKLKVSNSQEQLSSDYFNLRISKDVDRQFAFTVLSYLEDRLDFFTNSYGFQFPSTSIEVIIYLDKKFRAIYNHSPNWVDGLFDGRIRIPVSSNNLSSLSLDSKLKSVVTHELAHAVMSIQTKGKAIPTWVAEGLAQFFSCIESSCSTLTSHKSSEIFLSQQDFEGNFLSMEKQKAQAAYKQSLYIINLLEKTNSESIRIIVENLRLQTQLNSENILKGTGYTFKDIYNKAAESW